MAIDKIVVENFTVFDELEIEFSKGINVIVGENGTGKTHLLKLLYAFCETTHKKKTGESDSIKRDFNDKAKNIFQNIGLKELVRDSIKRDFNDKAKNIFQNIALKELVRDKTIIQHFDIKYNSNNNEYEYVVLSSLDGIEDTVDVVFNNVLRMSSYREKLEQYEKEKTQSVFIPVTEMLSHSKGFLNLNEKYEMPFDKTQVDIIINAGLPEVRELSDVSKKVMEKISTVINGDVVFEDDSYFVLKKDGKKTPFSMEAEGLRKFALLWQLLKNGSIQAGTVLLWDEPEANINPKLIPILVEILFELQRNGVQIFVTTHDYIFAKYFEVKQKENDNILFHALYNFPENGVKCETQEKFSFLEHNSIIEESINLYKEEIKVVME